MGTCGNLLSTAEEVAYFTQALLGNHSQLLKPETKREMLNVRPLKGSMHGYGYGLGLMDMSSLIKRPIGSLEFVGHAGQTYGFNSFSGHLPIVDASISIAANNEWTGVAGTSDILPKLIDVLYKYLPSQNGAAMHSFLI